MGPVLVSSIIVLVVTLCALVALVALVVLTLRQPTHIELA